MLIGIDASRATATRRTGTETYSLHLIRALLRLGSGHRFRLYTNGQPPDGFIGPQGWIAGAELRSIPFPRLWTHLRLSAEMLVDPPEVLFVPAHVIPAVHPRRSVVTVHDLGYLHYPEAHLPRDRRYLDWSTRWSARQAAAVLADSAATKADLVRAYGITADKVHVVHLGRDERLARVEDPAVLAGVRGRYGLGQRYLLYVGTLQPRKNLARDHRGIRPAGSEAGLGGRRACAGRQAGLAVRCAERPGVGTGTGGPGALPRLPAR